MLESLIQRATELNLGSSTSHSLSPTKSGDLGLRKAGSEASGRHSETIGAIRSDGEFSSIGYSYENFDGERIVAPPRATEGASCSYAHHQSDTAAFEADSPGCQTLSSLQAEALKDQGRRPRNQHGRFWG